jgi:HD-like signal output (HDOD) protein
MWHANIAKALLENWEMSEEVVAAVHQHEDLEYAHEGETDLADVLILANLLVSYREHPEGIELNLQGVKPATRMQLDADAFKRRLENRRWRSALRSAGS